MKKHKLLFLFLCFPIFILSQTAKKRIPEIENLLDSSFVKTQQFDLQGSIGFAQKALNLSKQKNYSRGIAIGNFRIGQCLAELNVYKQGLEYLDNAQKENQKLNDPVLSFEIRRVRSRIYGNSKLFQNAIAESKKALQIIPNFQKSEEEKLLARTLIYENIATAFTLMDIPDSAYHYLDENRIVLERSDVKKNLLNLINNYTNLGKYYAMTNNKEKSAFFFRKAINLARANNFPFLSNTYKEYGDLMLLQKQNDSALIYYKKAQELSEEGQFKNELPSIYQKISAAYNALNDPASGEKYKLKSLELQDGLNDEALSASSFVINTILNDQKENFDEENRKKSLYVMLISGSILVLIISFWWFYKRKINKLRSEKFLAAEKEQVLFRQKEEITQYYENETKKLEQKVNVAFDEIVALAKSNNSEFFTRFQEVYPDLIEKLLLKNKGLRISELTLCAYFFLGFSTKDISLYTFKSISTIRNRRQNLRTKLNIPADEDLELWFKNLIK